MEEIGDQVPETHPAPVLYLVPYNRAARQATLDPENEYFRSRLPNDVIALYVSFENPEKQVYTLGRAGCDIFLPDPRGADISKHQCSFVNTERGAVLLEDTSSKKNTEPHSSTNGGQTIGFAKGDASRRVLVARGINNMIHIGRDRYYQFEIHWDSDGLYDFKNKDENYRTGPRKSKQKRYLEGDKVGGGSYGNVFWAMDVHTGCVMAVKRFHNMQGKHLEFATREITNMFRISRTSSIHHDHILEILDCAGGGKGDDWGEIFMPLKAGNLKTLVQDPAVNADEVAEIVLRQMLRALACIAKHKIVHRDLKPENVLWEMDESTGGYHFRLGDFGLSNNPELAVTVAGTEPFMAPEVFNSGRQTEKVDIWSLFATIVWVKDVEGFRRRCAKMRAGEIHAWLARMAATQPQFWDIRGMASIRARDRPSARQLLRVLGALEEEGDGGGEVDEVTDALANALELDPTGEDDEEDAGVGPSRGWGGAEGEAPGMPYYETYVPDWASGDEEGEGSRTYRPPPMGESPRAEAWVKPYDEPYGPPDDGDPDSGTAVPDAWTARQLPTREMNDLVAAQVGQSRDRKGKGKKKKG